MAKHIDGRLAYADLLRAFATIAVIVLHLSGSQMGAVGVNTSAWAVFNVYDSLVRWCVPVFVMLSAAALSLIFSKAGTSVEWMLYTLLSGGLMLGAIYMATDYATSPVTQKGQMIYGALIGALIVLFRYFGIFPEGVTYAILIANALVWVIDRYTGPRRFGKVKGAKK